MTNSHHFYGTVRSRGGFDIDETTISPDAVYWLHCARGAFQKLERFVGTEKAMKVAPDRKPGQTWKDVCETYEMLANFAEKQVSGFTDNSEPVDPRTPEQVDADETAADWAAQVAELRGGG